MIGLLMMAAASASQPASVPSWYTGNTLYEFCRQDRSVTCLAYIIGAVDMAWKIETDAALAPAFCRPQGVPPNQMADVVTKWLADHPEQRQHAGAELVLIALGEAFPCSKR